MADMRCEGMSVLLRYCLKMGSASWVVPLLTMHSTIMASASGAGMKVGVGVGVMVGGLRVKVGPRVKVS